MRRETMLTPDCSAVRGRRLLVALSGGADSVALLAMLSRAREEYGLTLFAAHLDHGIRPESADDADFCRELCAKLGVPFLCKRVDVPAEAARRHVGLETLARAAYHLLGLQSFFTAGPKEVRAWTVRIGAKAPEAAGVIHSDFEKGFIKAETISYEDYVKLGGESGARDAGRLRMEGKDYVVQDGDVMVFRFNV